MSAMTSSGLEFPFRFAFSEPLWPCDFVPGKTQEIIESKIEKRIKNKFGPEARQKSYARRLKLGKNVAESGLYLCTLQTKCGVHMFQCRVEHACWSH